VAQKPRRVKEGWVGMIAAILLQLRPQENGRINGWSASVIKRDQPGTRAPGIRPLLSGLRLAAQSELPKHSRTSLEGGDANADLQGILRTHRASVALLYG
jgi:hypothetical protein